MARLSWAAEMAPLMAKAAAEMSNRVDLSDDEVRYAVLVPGVSTHMHMYVYVTRYFFDLEAYYFVHFLDLDKCKKSFGPFTCAHANNIYSVCVCVYAFACWSTCADHPRPQGFGRHFYNIQRVNRWL